MKYTISEFARQIRNLYPGDYDDLTDEKLTSLWLKKYPNNIDKVHLVKEEATQYSTYFSFRGVVATVFFGYLTYHIFIIASLISKIHDLMNQESIASRIIVYILNLNSNISINEFLNFIQFWIWLLLLSSIVKVIISLRHAFVTPKDNYKILGILGIFIDVMPMFLFILSHQTIDDAMTSLVLYIPTVIGALLLITRDEVELDA